MSGGSYQRKLEAWLKARQARIDAGEACTYVMRDPHVWQADRMCARPAKGEVDGEKRCGIHLRVRH